MSRRRTSLVIIMTGDGKGKTTSAFGQALRAAGSGLRVAIVQFIKGPWQTGEMRALARTDLPISVQRTGLGVTIEQLRDPRIPMEAHAAAAREGLELARGHLQSGQVDLVVLDEILGAITAGLFSTGDVLELITTRAPGVHVLLTGRNAPPSLIEAADLVSEVRLVRHPQTQGIAPQMGIEF
ncbi:MAG: cob(I)yrinic acid a,c-diamide adenosyltransferase [Candidatus Limnocylindrales bacterium]